MGRIQVGSPIIASPAVGTIVIQNGFPGFVAITHDSWTSGSGLAQPTSSQVYVAMLGASDESIGWSYTVASIDDLTYPSYQVQAE